MASCKIRVCPAGSGGFSHRVMKCGDLQKLHESFIRELPETTQLLKLPPEHSSSKLNPQLFLSGCGLAAIWPASCATATPWRRIPARISFGFQKHITIESQLCGCFGQTEPAQSPSPPLPGSQAHRRHWCLWGRLLPFVLHRLNQAWTTRSDSPHAAAAVPKSAPGVCRRSGKAISIQLTMVCRLNPWLVAVAARCGRGGAADRSALSVSRSCVLKRTSNNEKVFVCVQLSLIRRKPQEKAVDHAVICPFSSHAPVRLRNAPYNAAKPNEGRHSR